MRKRNILIISLLIVGILAFSIVNFVIVPKQQQEKQAYQMQQLNPLTHDIDYIMEYKNKYMGNASNLANLYLHLPLADVDRDFELESEELTLIVNYKETAARIGEVKLKTSLIYNATASFALIDNLQIITYNFTGSSYNVARSDVTALYDDFGNITKNTTWKKEVQHKLTDEEYVLQMFSKLFSEQV